MPLVPHALRARPGCNSGVNPAEKIWWRFKRAFTNKTFDTLDQVSDFISRQVCSLSNAEVKSICDFSYLKTASRFWSIL